MSKHDVIPVFFTIDDGFAPFCDVAVASLADHASPDRRYRIYIVYQTLSDRHREQLLALARPNVEIVPRPMTENLSAITDRMSSLLRADLFTVTIFYRLFLPRIFSQYDKGIYLDSDIVLNDDVAKLYDVDLGANLLGAVPDFSIQGNADLMAYTHRAIGVDTYINSGVLLLNMKGLRDAHITDNFLHLYETYHIVTIAPDQDYLNALCYGKTLYLPERWDVMPLPGKPAFENPGLIHYNLYMKPWWYDGVGEEEYFWKYARKVAMADEIKAVKDAIDPVRKKEEDDRHMADMVATAKRVTASSNTFRAVFASGKEHRL